MHGAQIFEPAKYARMLGVTVTELSRLETLHAAMKSSLFGGVGSVLCVARFTM